MSPRELRPNLHRDRKSTRLRFRLLVCICLFSSGLFRGLALLASDCLSSRIERMDHPGSLAQPAVASIPHVSNPASSSPTPRGRVEGTLSPSFSPREFDMGRKAHAINTKFLKSSKAGRSDPMMLDFGPKILGKKKKKYHAFVPADPRQPSRRRPKGRPEQAESFFGMVPAAATLPPRRAASLFPGVVRIRTCMPNP